MLGIAGMVVLTGGPFPQCIPSAVIARAEQLGLSLIEQPSPLKLVFVTHLIDTALMHMTQVRRSRNHILGQLLTGDYPSLAIARQRAAHLQLMLDIPRRLVVLRLSGIETLFERQGLAQGEQLWQATRQSMEDQLEAWGRSRPGTVTVEMPGDLFVLLLADADDLPAALTTLRRQLIGVAGELDMYMGLSSVAEDCGHYRRVLNEARQALNVAQKLRPESGYCDFNELGVLGLLQGESTARSSTTSSKRHSARCSCPAVNTLKYSCIPSTLCSRKMATGSRLPSAWDFTVTPSINVSSASNN